jgi:hypothetical protein
MSFDGVTGELCAVGGRGVESRVRPFLARPSKCANGRGVIKSKILRMQNNSRHDVKSWFCPSSRGIEKSILLRGPYTRKPGRGLGRRRDTPKQIIVLQQKWVKRAY